ncbi:hypothetical protein RRG08_048095 [Elysia crispata]|uniref:Uncharacterized protein n=1 Tax=Elysia crispata TaxID=231223 RepID=A0AAE1B441_9GAST|nr:hypothetical protein RRG08_048095 [Elysia crispata]
MLKLFQCYTMVELFHCYTMLKLFHCYNMTELRHFAKFYIHGFPRQSSNTLTELRHFGKFYIRGFPRQSSDTLAELKHFAKFYIRGFPRQSSNTLTELKHFAKFYIHGFPRQSSNTLVSFTSIVSPDRAQIQGLPAHCVSNTLPTEVYEASGYSEQNEEKICDPHQTGETGIWCGEGFQDFFQARQFQV